MPPKTGFANITFPFYDQVPFVLRSRQATHNTYTEREQICKLSRLSKIPSRSACNDNSDVSYHFRENTFTCVHPHGSLCVYVCVCELSLVGNFLPMQVCFAFRIVSDNKVAQLSCLLYPRYSYETLVIYRMYKYKQNGFQFSFLSRQVGIKTFVKFSVSLREQLLHWNER